MERKLNYILSLDGVSPADKRFAGIQGEDRATAIIVTPDDALLSKVTNAGEDVFCSFDVLCENGELFQGEKKEIARISEPFYLTEAMTASGLDVIVIVKVMCTGSSIHKAQLKLYFEACPTYKTLTADKKDEVLSLQKAAQEIFASFEEKVQGAEKLLDAKALAAAGSAGLAAGHLDKVIRLSDNAKAFSESAEQSSEEAKASAMAAKQDFETVKGLFSAAIQNIDNHNSNPDAHGDIREQLDLASGRIEDIEKELAAVGSESAENPWALLHDITLTEAVNEIALDTNCKEIYIEGVFNMSEDKGGKSVSVYLDQKNKYRLATSGATVSASDLKLYMRGEISLAPNGRLKGLLITDGNVLGYSKYPIESVLSQNFANAEGNIGGIKIQCVTMETGSTIKVWGR